MLEITDIIMEFLVHDDDKQESRAFILAVVDGGYAFGGAHKKPVRLAGMPTQHIWQFNEADRQIYTDLFEAVYEYRRTLADLLTTSNASDKLQRYLDLSARAVRTEG